MIFAAGVLAIVVGACGGGDGESASSSASGTEPGSGGATTSTTGATATSVPTTAATSVPTTTTTTLLNGFELIANTSADPAAPVSEVGTPDVAAAAAIAGELAANDIPLAGAAIWVLPVVGSEERLLVFEIHAATTDSETEAGGDLFEVLVNSAVVAEAAVTRFVFHYFDTDDEGDFVFTMTMPLEALFRAVTEDADISDQILVKQRRLDGTEDSP